MDQKQQSKTTTFKPDKVIKYIPLSLYLSMLIYGVACGGEEVGGGGGGGSDGIVLSLSLCKFSCINFHLLSYLFMLHIKLCPVIFTHQQLSKNYMLDFDQTSTTILVK